MSRRVGLVCGSYHREEVERMLAFATDEAEQHDLTIGDVVWVPGSMEVPLALDRLLASHDAAACLGIIEKGETQHGLASRNLNLKLSLERLLIGLSAGAGREGLRGRPRE